MNIQDCSLCLELTTTDYHSRCCGARLCRQCFDSIIEPKPTCPHCGWVIDPVDNAATISNLLVAATTKTTSIISAHLATISAKIELVETSLSNLAANTADLNRQLVTNSVSVTQEQLSAQQLADLRQRLDLYSTSMVKSQQLKLDQLLNYHKLLQTRLGTIVYGLASDQISLLYLTQTWSVEPVNLNYSDDCNHEHHRRVWWRRDNLNFTTPWQLIPVTDYPNTTVAKPSIREFLIPGSQKFLTRLADDSLAVATVTVQSEQIAIGLKLLIQDQGWWTPSSQPILTFVVARPYSSPPHGVGMGLRRSSLNQVEGYYCYYSVDRLTLTGIKKLLVLKDFELTKESTQSSQLTNQTRSLTYHVTLSSQPSQVYRYGQTLLTIVAGRLTVIRLDSNDQNHLIMTSPQTDLTISRVDGDLVWLNWSNQVVWTYNYQDLVSNGLSQVNGLVSPAPIKTQPYNGPTDHIGYLELVAPDVIVYCHYGQQILTTADRPVWQKAFQSAAVTGDGVICLV